MRAADLIKLGETYGNHVGLRPSTVAVYAVNDGKFFDRLRDGGGCTLKTADRLISYLAGNWPADLEWPRHIPRPPKSKDAA